MFLISRNQIIIMRGQEERQQYINEIKKIRVKMELKPYDDNYLNSLGLDELEKLYIRHDAYLLPVKHKKASRFNKKFMVILVLIAVCISVILLVLNTFQWGRTILPEPGKAQGTPGNGEQPQDDISACVCDEKPDVCDYADCECDPSCT